MISSNDADSDDEEDMVNKALPSEKPAATSIGSTATGEEELKEGDINVDDVAYDVVLFLEKVTDGLKIGLEKYFIWQRLITTLSHVS